MASRATMKFLKDYQDASKRLEAEAMIKTPSNELELTHRLMSGTRELVCRCILSDDPRSLLFLFEQLHIVLKILGQPDAALYLTHANNILVSYFQKFGSF